MSKTITFALLAVLVATGVHADPRRPRAGGEINIQTEAVSTPRIVVQKPRAGGERGSEAVAQMPGASMSRSRILNARAGERIVAPPKTAPVMAEADGGETLPEAADAAQYARR